MADFHSSPLGRLRNRLAKGSALGLFCKTTDESFVEAVGVAGLHFAIIDAEHGPIGPEVMKRNLMACRAGGVAGIVRTPGLDVHAIGSALDLGADGVQVPNISSADEAKAAVHAARFHPKGMRGVCRFVAAAKYGARERDQYFSKENEKLLILQVEGTAGVQALDEILQVRGFDVLFVGPYDLSQAVGRPGDIDAPQVRDLVESIRSSAISAGVRLGLFVDDTSRAREASEAGFSYIACGVDINIFRSACEITLSSWRDS